MRKCPQSLFHSILFIIQTPRGIFHRRDEILVADTETLALEACMIETETETEIFHLNLTIGGQETVTIIVGGDD